MDKPNPFTPSFGRIPAHFAGRTSFLSAMAKALADERRTSPDLATILVGPRGTGKTALLGSIGQEAAAHGWIVAQVTANEGMLVDVIERLQESAADLVDSSSATRVKSLSIGSSFAVEFDRATPYEGNWRTQMNRLFAQLEPYGSGILITVDEVQRDCAELETLTQAFQHFLTEGKPAALVMAGLPSEVSAMVSSKVVSFLRRARHHHIGRIGNADVEVALRKTLADEDATIDDDAMAAAVSAIDGFPYMLQLVGYWMWEEADRSPIAFEDAQRGIRLAAGELRDGVLAATYRELSNGDLRFLEAMLPDEGPSALADIAQRMGVQSNYASKYKKRLIEAGVVGDVGQRHYTVELPGFKEYVRDSLI